MVLEILDTTLRDGEQTSGVAFSPEEKMTMAQMLLMELGVDRLEVASARVSDGEFQAAKKIAKWAMKNKKLDRIEVLGFIDGGKSIDWIYEAGICVVNLLTKGSLNHVTNQLRKTPDEHIQDVQASIDYAVSKGFSVNIYLEDWSNGMRHSPDYVYQLVDALQGDSVKRFMLPDTLGILNPDESYTFVRQMLDRYPSIHFDFHSHNDYDLAAANTYYAIKAGARGVHTTVNGLGERAGNVPLSSVIAVAKDHLGATLRIHEEKISMVSKMVETFSGIRIPSNKPLIGENVFTQTCGVHADGDNKHNLYFNDLLPERFGRVRSYALGKTSGKANIEQNLKELGINLPKESMKKVTQRIIELGDKKEYMTKEDLPYIIADVLRSSAVEQTIKIENFSLNSTLNLKPLAALRVSIDGKIYQENSSGDGQYDAFMKALWKIYDKLDKHHPRLLDYIVRIPPGGKTDALVEAIIAWDYRGNEFKTRGLDSDQTIAAIKATQKMLNVIESM